MIGLKDFKKKEQARSTKSESPYFKLQPGQKVRIRPLVELDDEGKNFDPEAGSANFVREYTNPVKFWLSIVDTEDTEGRCVGKEMVSQFGWFKAQNPDPKKGQHNDKTKNWNPKTRFYLPVVVDRLDGSEPTVEVLQLSFGGKAPSQALIDFYEAKGTITDRWWFYSRNDAEVMQEVRYSFTPDDPEPFEFDGEIPNVNDAPYVNNVPYEEQRAFLQIDATYGGQQQQKSSAASEEKSSSTDSDEDEVW